MVITVGVDDDDITTDGGNGVGRNAGFGGGGGAANTDDHSVCRTSQRYDADSDEDQMLQPHPQFWLFLNVTDELINVYFHHRYHGYWFSFVWCWGGEGGLGMSLLYWMSFIYPSFAVFCIFWLFLKFSIENLKSRASRDCEGVLWTNIRSPLQSFRLNEQNDLALGSSLVFFQ